MKPNKNPSKIWNISEGLTLKLVGIFALFLVIVIGIYYGSGVARTYFWGNSLTDISTEQLLMEAIKQGTSVNYDIECDFDEVNTFLMGHFEEIKVPVEYNEYGSRIYFSSSNESYTVRNLTNTNYVPERFDIKGFKGMRCKIVGGINT